MEQHWPRPSAPDFGQRYSACIKSAFAPLVSVTEPRGEWTTAALQHSDNHRIVLADTNLPE